MFLHIGRFTKQMKEAFKDYRLNIGNINNGLLIASGHWIIWIENDRVPNGIKAAVMLFAGTMPKPGELFSVSKGMPEPQYSVEKEFYLKFLAKSDLYAKLVLTPILLTENRDIRMLQCPGDRRIYGINQDFLDFIDKEAVDFDAGESTPIGPCFDEDINHGIYWYNDFGLVMIMPMASKKIEIPAVLSLLCFKEDGKIERDNFEERIREAFRHLEEAGESDEIDTRLEPNKEVDAEE